MLLCSFRIKITWRTPTQLLLFLWFVVCSACVGKEGRRQKEAVKIVSEWVGKEFLFPEDIPCYVYQKNDTLRAICDEQFQKEYKILMYVDSAGCSDCRLKLPAWKQLMKEADSLFQGRVGFLLFFQPKSEREMTFLLLSNRFDNPVFMDINGTINRLNNFPQEIEHQCFLLDKNNKVLLIGNPVLNPKIWELYKSQIGGDNKSPPEILTTVNIDRVIHNYGTIQKGSSRSAVFTVTNTGNNPLIIFHVSTSCGCTQITWDKQPIKPGQTANISVEMTPDETGYFSQAITAYCNISESFLRFTVAGNAIQ